MTTDTPRTDAAYKNHEWDLMDHIPLEFARQIERELAISLEKQVKAQAEVERLTKLTEDCLNVIRVYCPTFYNDAMERFNKTNK